MKIKGFWHIWAVNHWYSIIQDQVRILLTSGLYDACEEIRIGFIGTPENKELFEKYFLSVYPKLKLMYFSENPLEYEFPTLRLIEKDTSSYIGFYFHTKGVTRPFETVIQHWRSYLNETVLARWMYHRDRIEKGYDVSSVNYLRAPNHFSGNFFWFNREYIDRCPKLDTLDKNNRWHCEQWICMSNPNFYSSPHVEPGNAVFPIKYK